MFELALFEIFFFCGLGVNSLVCRLGTLFGESFSDCWGYLGEWECALGERAGRGGILGEVNGE